MLKLPTHSGFHDLFLKWSVLLRSCIFVFLVWTYVFFFIFGSLSNLDWVAQTLIKFKFQLILKCKLIPCTFQVILSVNWHLNLNNVLTFWMECLESVVLHKCIVFHYHQVRTEYWHKTTISCLPLYRKKTFTFFDNFYLIW